MEDGERLDESLDKRSSKSSSVEAKFASDSTEHVVLFPRLLALDKGQGPSLLVGVVTALSKSFPVGVVLLSNIPWAASSSLHASFRLFWGWKGEGGGREREGGREGQEGGREEGGRRREGGR